MNSITKNNSIPKQRGVFFGHEKVKRGQILRNKRRIHGKTMEGQEFYIGELKGGF